MTFIPSFPPSVWKLIDMALEEDMGRGDVTSEAIFTVDQKAQGDFVAKTPLVVSGLDVAAAVFSRLDPSLEMTFYVTDGQYVPAMTKMMHIQGPARSILTAERTALNFVQRLSGIATITQKFVEKVSGTKAQILDTRKTIPGFRFLDKRAVRHGGGRNHRVDLASLVLIKDNHIEALGSITKAISQVAKRAPHGLRVEVEVTNLTQVKEALLSKVDILLLDNMSPLQVKEAVDLIKSFAAGTLPFIEVSGGVSLENVRSYAEAGADFISVGALTHSVKASDISLEVITSHLL